VPWWDWTSDLSHQVGVPAAYTEPQAGGGRNPLAGGPMPDMPDDPARQTRRFPGAPSELPTADQVDLVLSLTSYVDFSSQLQDIHDQIHGWTGGIDPGDPNRGGDMGVTATSA
jgi:tyrosinase